MKNLIFLIKLYIKLIEFFRINYFFQQFPILLLLIQLKYALNNYYKKLMLLSFFFFFKFNSSNPKLFLFSLSFSLKEDLNLFSSVQEILKKRKAILHK